MKIDFSVKKHSGGLLQTWKKDESEKSAHCPLMEKECPIINTDFFPVRLKKHETEAFFYTCGDRSRFDSETDALKYKEEIDKLHSLLNYIPVEEDFLSEMFVSIARGFDLIVGEWITEEEFWLFIKDASDINRLKDYLIFRFPKYKKTIEDQKTYNDLEIGRYNYVIVLKETQMGDYSNFVLDDSHIGIMSDNRLREKINTYFPSQ